MIKWLFLLLIAIFVYGAWFPEENINETLSLNSFIDDGQTTLKELEKLTQEHVAVISSYSPSEYFQANKSLESDLNQLPLIRDIIKPLSKRLMELKYCTEPGCVQALLEYTDWLRNEIMNCRENSPNSIQCKVLHHVMDKIESEKGEANLEVDKTEK